MATIEITQLTAFVTVARSGSFTKAADVLDTQKAHLSRVISKLEAQLGSRLLQRSTRSLVLTETGKEFFERASGILQALEETEAAMAQAQSAPRGVLRLTCGVEFGQLVVNTWITAYLKKYPEVRVEAEFTNRVVDVVHEGIDIAIRIGALSDSSLAARKIGEINYALYAGPTYLQGKPKLRAPEQLKDFDRVAFASSGTPSWRLFRSDESALIDTQPRLMVNNNIAARDAAISGLGLVLLPTFLAQPQLEQGTLVEVLSGWTRSPAPVHAVFASSRYMTPKVRAFVDRAVAAFASA